VTARWSRRARGSSPRPREDSETTKSVLIPPDSHSLRGGWLEEDLRLSRCTRLGFHPQSQIEMATRTLGRCLRRGTYFGRSFTRVSRPMRIHRHTLTGVASGARAPGAQAFGVQPHEEFRGSQQPLRVTDVGLKRVDTRRCGRGHPFDECARASSSEICRIRLTTSWSKEARSKAQRPKACPWT